MKPPYLTRAMQALEKMPPAKGAPVRVTVYHRPLCPLPGGLGACTCKPWELRLEYHYRPATRAQGRDA